MLNFSFDTKCLSAGGLYSDNCISVPFRGVSRQIHGIIVISTKSDCNYRDYA